MDGCGLITFLIPNVFLVSFGFSHITAESKVVNEELLTLAETIEHITRRRRIIFKIYVSGVSRQFLRFEMLGIS